jgi:hypothetical protein
MEKEKNEESRGVKYCNNVAIPDWEKSRNKPTFMEKWLSTVREHDKVTLFFHHKLSG